MIKFDTEHFVDLIKNICEAHNITFISATFDNEVERQILQHYAKPGKVRQTDITTKMTFEMEFKHEPQFKELKPWES